MPDGDCSARDSDFHLNFAHLLLPMYLAHDMVTTSGTRLSARPAIALALATFFTSSRHVLSAFSVRILAAKWLRTS